ncbi:MAG: hypothetical protein WAO98_04510 [Alphaproteobacteria bacterium]
MIKSLVAVAFLLTLPSMPASANDAVSDTAYKNLIEKNTLRCGYSP